MHVEAFFSSSEYNKYKPKVVEQNAHEMKRDGRITYKQLQRINGNK